MRLLRCIIVVGILLAGWSISEASPPQNFTNELVTSTVTQPVALAFLPDGRMLIVEKGGRILVSDPSSLPLSRATYMTITNISADDERGLLNLVLDPGFGISNNYFYVYYHPGSPEIGRIARFTHLENTGGLTSRGDLTSEFVVWEDTEGYPACCHYGGGLDFGPDGNLYLTIGDKFTAGNAQDLTKAAGKIIRVAPDGTFPPGNFGLSDGVGGSIYDGIFAYGLRNPYRATWDLSTGRFFIGEVGGNKQDISTEDVHVATLLDAGTNFGWPFCEGACDNPDFPNCNCALHDDPIFYYPHGGSGASITGGMVYRGNKFPSSPYAGAYFYGDYVRQFIRYVTFDGSGTVVTGDFDFDSAAGQVVFIGQSPDGALYYTTINGEVHRIVYNLGNLPPTITTADATPDLGTPPHEVTFTGSAIDPEGDSLTFKWVYGDGDSVTGNVVADNVPTQMHTYTTNGLYTATLYVSDPTHAAAFTSRLVRVGNPPSVTITDPVNLTTFVAGDTIFYAGIADDIDETLDGSHYAWTLRFRHNEHFHPGPFLSAPGTGGFWVIDSTGHDWHDDTGYVLDVLVTDSDGLTGADTVEVLPQKVNLTFDTTPGGIPVSIDGIPNTTPFAYDTMVGFEHTISVPAVQCAAGSLYTFAGWSDGASATHVLTVPMVDSTYIATFTSGGECGLPLETGLVMHVSGDVDVNTSGSTVTSWLDQTTSGNDLTTVLGAPTFVADGLNGHGVVSFNGVTDGLGRTGFVGLPTGSADRTMLMVVRYESDGWGGFAYGTGLCNNAFGLSVANTANNGHLMVQGWCTPNDFVSGEPGNGAGWMAHAVVLQSNVFTHYKDGVVIGTGTHTFATGTQRIRLGTELDEDPKINMQVAEILVFDRALTSFELTQIQAYFESLYFPPPAPTVTITNPTEGAMIPGDSISVSWTTGGDISAAEHVHVQLDTLPELTFAQFSATHVFNGVSVGSHVVHVELATVGHLVLAVDSAHVTVTGTPPMTQNDAAVVMQNDSVIIDVLSNDFDPDGGIEPTTVTIVIPPLHGTITAIEYATGIVHYTHDGSYAPADSFRYTVQDNLGNTSNASSVTLDVLLTGNPPAVEHVVATASSPDVTPDDSLSVAYDLLAPATVGAIAWYRNDSPYAALFMPMEGSAGPALGDYSGSGHAAIPSGTPSWSASGGVNGSGAYSFDSSDGLIVADAADFDVDYVTIAAWVRLDSYVDDQRVVSKEFGTTQPYSIYTLAIGSDGIASPEEDRIDFRIGLVGQNRIRVIGSQTIPLGIWTHVAATFDGTSINLYVNGQPDVSVAATGLLRKNDEAVYVGSSQFYGQYFSGSIDDVFVFGHALSGGQIDALYSVSDAVIVPQETSLGETWRACITPFGAGVSGVIAHSNTLAVGNAAPVAGDDLLSVSWSDSVAVDVLANDSDADGTIDSTSVTIVMPPVHGTATINAVTGVITYHHDASTAVVDSFKYTVDDNSGATSNIATVRASVDIASAVDGTTNLPTRFALHQNIPNPFNPVTMITYDVPSGGAYVKLDIYDVSGRLVARLVDGVQSGGRHHITWNGKGRNDQVASGVYFYRLQAPGFQQTRKMVLLQ